ncbi:MAG: hypothetical protein ABI969_10820, partial [bacterium]
MTQKRPAVFAASLFVFDQNGRSSSSGNGVSSYGGGSLGGGASLGGGPERPPARGVGAGYGLGPLRGGQMIPSQPGPPRSFGLFLHLKSGAFGLRLVSRSSHMGPPQIGQFGMPSAAFDGSTLGAA